MYQIDDLIQYGNTGVCRVSDIKPIDFSDGQGEQLYYVLQPVNQDCTISTPVANGKVFMRPIVSKEEAEKLINSIPSIQADAFYSHALRDLVEHYEASLNTHSCVDLIELTMSLYAKRKYVTEHKRKFGAVDERFMKRAEDLLFGELGAALGIEQSDVPRYFAKRVKIIAAQ